MYKILAIETSCDDTSIAVFFDDTLQTMDTRSQIKIHNKTGWVVPEVAAREHANSIFEVLETVLQDSWVKLEEVTHIAVTVQPGLIPSLLTGITVARMLANIYSIPLIEIDHIQAHIFSNYLEREESDINYPYMCLTVSGWHNELYFMKSMFEMKKIGQTTDDASGEAFDKVAKMMWLGYPGGPIISKLASEYIWESTQLFPRVWLEKKAHDFSFSGLKSSVKREVEKRWELTKLDRQKIAFEFQQAVIEVLAYKLVQSAEQKNCQHIMLAGWVSANTQLRDEIQKLADDKWLTFLYPKKLTYCMDNAAMIWILWYYKVKYNKSFTI